MRHSQQEKMVSIGASSQIEEDCDNGLIYKYPNDRDLLAREADNLSALQGAERVVKLIRTDETRGCLVLEKAPGYKLTDIIRYHGGLSLTDAQEVVSQVASVLQFMHERDGGGQIHYDISPSNIFWDSVERDVTLIDFGSSYRLSNIPSEYFEYVVGTPLYLAPEKLRPDPKEGRASDVYALGAVWYELIEETPPFDPVLGNLYTQIKTVTPEIPRRLRGVANFAELLSAMLEKSPCNRPSSQEVASALVSA